MSFRTINGACHCGNIRFDLQWPASATEIKVRRCGCTFCRKHGGAWTSHRDAELAVSLGDESLVSRYRFGTETADFLVCSVCGVTPLVLSEIDGDIHAVVSVNAFREVEGFTLSEKVMDFEGESTGSRLDRRKRYWISQVRIGTEG